jgi:DeoR family fructose operon transcriptional repressor
MNKHVITRRKLIEQYLRDRQFSTIKELASEFSVSISTIQRDVIKMLNEGKIEKSHGYVMLPKNLSYIPSFVSRINIQANNKHAIASKAATLLNENDNIFVDVGSTCLMFYEKIITANITVFTNNLMIAVTNNGNYQTYVLEGWADKRNLGVHGKTTIENLNKINLDKLFFSCVGVDIDGNILCFKESDRGLINNIRKMKCEKILLLDSGKFGSDGASTILSVNDIDIIITDSDIPKEYKDMILKTNVNLIIA